MDAATFIKRVGRLPSLSSLYYELTRAVENPNASVEMIGDIVRKDPSMAARLLKLANSAYYGFPSKVMSIEDALQLIGMREMRDMALATSVIGAFKNVPQRLLKVPDFWRHCIGLRRGLQPSGPSAQRSCSRALLCCRAPARHRQTGDVLVSAGRVRTNPSPVRIGEERFLQCRDPNSGFRPRRFGRPNC